MGFFSRVDGPLRGSITQVRYWTRLSGLAAWKGAASFYDSDNLTFASSIAYHALLSLFPFFLLAFAILGNATADEADRATVLSFVLRYFPTQFEFVTVQLDAMRHSGATIGIAGSLLLIWAALGVFGAITSAVNHAWGVEKQPTFLRHKLVSFVMLVAAGLLLLIALIIVSVTGVVGATWFSTVVDRVPGLAVMRSLAVQNGTTMMFILVAGLIYYFVPNAKVRFWDVWVGAVVAGLLLKGALAGFAWYVRDMTRFSVIHGSIAAVIVFLLWIYTSSIILLYGAEFTAALARLRRHRPEEVPAAPSPRP